jgi:hypothetical protein
MKISTKTAAQMMQTPMNASARRYPPSARPMPTRPRNPRMATVAPGPMACPLVASVATAASVPTTPATSARRPRR